MERLSRLCWLGLVLASTTAFAPPKCRTHPFFVITPSVASRQLSFNKFSSEEQSNNVFERLEKILDRLDTLKSAGFVDSNSASPLLMRGPGFKRIFFWLFIGFMYKWYRARFINKVKLQCACSLICVIPLFFCVLRMLTQRFVHAYCQNRQIPVWDRQPQWNMVVTNREQEKELKAYTCKNCGSTLFIARNRNWFFEGDTGLAGLGCFTCGAKGKDNFVMDRDRILEDVGDDDDYFDYERPLDFVTAAERRALLKKAKGNEEVANQMLIDQTKEAATSSRPEGDDGDIEMPAKETEQETKEAAETEIAKLDDKKEEEVKPTEETKATTGNVASSEAAPQEDVPKKASKKKKPKKTKKSDPIVESEPSLDDLDLSALGMDDL